jgi:glycosyltransferase involved in cell wall biosynthesis
MNKEKITAIIPAQNEEGRIAGVLDVVSKCQFLSEIIVINDASTDKTGEIIQKYKVKYLENKQNIGKTLSVKRAVQMSENNIILLLDSDLIGLTEKNLVDLVTPIMNNEAEMTLSLRGNAVLRRLGVDPFTGERAIRKDLLLEPSIWTDIGCYSLESLLNRYLVRSNKRIRVVDTPNIKIVYKASKEGALRGWLRESKIWLYDIPKAVGFWDQLRIFYYIKKSNH